MGRPQWTGYLQPWIESHGDKQSVYSGWPQQLARSWGSAAREPWRVSAAACVLQETALEAFERRARDLMASLGDLAELVWLQESKQRALRIVRGLDSTNPLGPWQNYCEAFVRRPVIQGPQARKASEATASLKK